MDINYKILWFEDTDESFETLSRRTSRYVEGKNLRCEIKRIYGISDFEISQYDLNSYEVLVVDLQLSQGSKGYEIINTIRSSNYVNDILFYSSAGTSVLETAMKDYRLEGVFISERDNRLFMEKIKQLIDKSVRRSENIINIRGIVMDETSELDTQMAEIVLASQALMDVEEISAIKKYISRELLQNKATQITKLTTKYSDENEWALSDLLNEHEFNSLMRARLVNKVLGKGENQTIRDAVSRCNDKIPEEFLTSTGKIAFADAYDKKVIVFRNKLAHVKRLNAQNPVPIGTIDGVEHRCDSEFCSMMRERLIRYRCWLEAIYESLEQK
jgi:hypothetical protein